MIEVLDIIKSYNIEEVNFVEPLQDNVYLVHTACNKYILKEKNEEKFELEHAVL